MNNGRAQEERLMEAKDKVAEKANEAYEALQYFAGLPDPPGHRAGEYRLDLEDLMMAVDAWSKASEEFLAWLQSRPAVLK